MGDVPRSALDHLVIADGDGDGDGDGIVVVDALLVSRSDPTGVATLEKIEAILTDGTVFELGDPVPPPDRGRGGRPRDHPAWTLLFWEAPLSLFGSARAVEAELARPLV